MDKIKIKNFILNFRSIPTRPTEITSTLGINVLARIPASTRWVNPAPRTVSIVKYTPWSASVLRSTTKEWYCVAMILYFTKIYVASYFILFYFPIFFSLRHYLGFWQLRSMSSVSIFKRFLKDSWTCNRARLNFSFVLNRIPQTALIYIFNVLLYFLIYSSLPSFVLSFLKYLFELFHLEAIKSNARNRCHTINSRGKLKTGCYMEYHQITYHFANFYKISLKNNSLN